MSETCSVQALAEAVKGMPAAMGMSEGITASRAICAYGRTKDAALGQAILEKAKELAGRENGLTGGIEAAEYPSPWCLLYAAYKICPEEIYKNKIVELEKSDTYMGLCFDMNYETMFGGKERYHALTLQFGRLAERPFKSDMERAAFMLALIDTIEAIDQPVYELYRSLVDIFRKQMKSLGGRQMEDSQAKEVLSCAVKRAGRMKVILEEKYKAYICG